MAVNERELTDVLLAKLQDRCEADASSNSTATQIEGVIIGVHPGDSPDYSGRLEMTPVSIEPHVRRQVWDREMWSNALQLDAIRSLAQISTRAWTLRGNGYEVPSLEWHPTKLHIAEPGNSVWSPILVSVREHIGIHEGAPVLAAAELSQLAVCMTEPEGGLSGVNTSPE